MGGILLLAGIAGCECGGGNTALCEPKTCQELGKNCGVVDDGCGGQLHCGFCGGGLTCGGGGVPNVCGGEVSCTPTTCEDAGVSCGTISDGCGGQITCGFCTSGRTCDTWTHTCEVATCTPQTCTSVGAECGQAPDGCGGVLTCGGADACNGSFCGGGGPNRCGTDPCQPTLETCPADACGVHSNGCGSVLDCLGCPANQVCTLGGTCGASPDVVGQPCTRDGECATGICRSAGWPGGYCTTVCTSDDQCGAGNHCAFSSDGSGLCVVSCQGVCPRAGYVCADLDGDGARECVPGGTSSGSHVGDPCTSVADCSGNVGAVCIPPPEGGPNGYCTVRCGAGARTCPSGSHCGFNSGNSVCLQDCQQSSECQAGNVCTDWDGDGISECTPGKPVGGACTGDAECASGHCATASTGFEGGYCTQPCTSTSECPAGSACDPTSAQCVKTCTSSLDCRGSGYACVDLGGGASACLPYGGGGGAPGSPCQSVADCAGGRQAVCTDDGTGLKRCVVACTSDAECGGGACVDQGTTKGCAAGCTSDADCPTSTTCTSTQDGKQVCLPSGLSGDGSVGSLCTVDDDCQGTGMICRTHESTTWRGGYCSAGCATGLSCPQGSHCSVMASKDGAQGGLCYQDCTSDADCGRTGFRCWDANGDGTPECAGWAGGSGTIGDPCDALDACGGGEAGLCFLAPAYPLGYCSESCDGRACSGSNHCSHNPDDPNDPNRFCMDAGCCSEFTLCDLDEIEGNNYPPCPAGSSCRSVSTLSLGSNVGACAADVPPCGPTTPCPDDTFCSEDQNGLCLLCAGAEQCRDDYDCYDLDKTGDRECWPSAKGSGAPGTPCTRLRDCTGGVHGRCAVEDARGHFRGGMCTWDCSDPDVRCPAGSACVNTVANVPGAQSHRWCLPTCSSDSQCRAGYSCQSLESGKPSVCFPSQ